MAVLKVLHSDIRAWCDRKLRVLRGICCGTLRGMAEKHRVCDASAASVRVGTWELPLVGEASEARVCAGNVAAWVAIVADVGTVGSNDLHLLDPGVRRDRL